MDAVDSRPPVAAFRPSGRAVRDILEDAVGGRRIDAGDALRLLADGDLLDLGLAAD